MTATVPIFTAVAPVKEKPWICTLALGKTAGGLNPVILGVTLKLVVLVPVPAVVVTLIGPVEAPAGTLKVIDVADTTVKAPFVLKPLMETSVTLVKLLPVMVTLVPTAPVVGVKLVTLGVTPNCDGEEAVPSGVVTVTVLVTAVDGTLTFICCELIN